MQHDYQIENRLHDVLPLIQPIEHNAQMYSHSYICALTVRTVHMRHHLSQVDHCACTIDVYTVDEQHMPGVKPRLAWFLNVSHCGYSI